MQDRSLDNAKRYAGGLGCSTRFVKTNPIVPSFTSRVGALRVCALWRAAHRIGKSAANQIFSGCRRLLLGEPRHLIVAALDLDTRALEVIPDRLIAPAQ